MKILKGILLLSAILCFTACAWEIPERISLKTQAEYNFTMESYHQDLSEELSVDNIFTELPIKNSRIYDYFPGKKDTKTQQYYMKIPLLEIPIDFSGFFQASSLAESVERMSFSQTLKVPKISFDISKNLELSALEKAINGALTAKGSGSGEVSFPIEFDSVSYSSGYFTVSCPGIADGTKVVLDNDNSTRSATFSSGVAKISISGFTFYDDMTLTFSSTGKNYVATVDSSSRINKIQGLTIDSEISLPISIPVSIDADDGFESCTISQGNLNTEISIPSSWSNVDIDCEITASGGMEFKSPRTDGEEVNVNLAGQKITGLNAVITATVYLQLDNASLSFSAAPVLKGSSEINGFSKVALGMNGVNTQLTAVEPMTESMLASVISIILKSSGLKGTYTNTLPSGNDIQINAASDFLGLSNGKGVLASGTTDGQFKIMSPENTEKLVKISPFPAAKNEYNSWDFLMNIKFPGSTDDKPSRIEIANVSPGEEYKVEMTVAPETNWKEMVINAQSMNRADKSPIGFNILSAFSALGETLGIDFANQSEIYTVPTYIYCNKPKVNSGYADPFVNTGFAGAIKMFVGKTKENGDIEKILHPVTGSLLEKEFSKTNEQLKYVSAPNLDFVDNTVITDVGQYEYTKFNDIKDLMNNAKDEQEIFLDYDVSFTNGNANKVITVTPEMLDKNTSATAIGVSAVVILPFKFYANNGDIYISLNKMMGDDDQSDVMGRDSASSSTTIEDISDVIRSMSIIFKTNSMPLYSTPETKLVLDLNCGLPPKIYNIQSGIITINAGEMAKIFATYPVYSTMDCLIAERSVFSIPRLASLDMSLNLKIETDGTFNLFGGN